MAGSPEAFSSSRALTFLTFTFYKKERESRQGSPWEVPFPQERGAMNARLTLRPGRRGTKKLLRSIVCCLVVRSAK